MTQLPNPSCAEFFYEHTLFMHAKELT